MTSQSASEAEHIAEIERDWNAFDMRAVLLKWRKDADMKDVTVKLKVSELRNDPVKSYLVTVDAKLRYDVHLKSTVKLNVFTVYEGSGEREGKPAMLLSFYIPSIPSPYLRTTLHSFTDEQFRISRKQGGSTLAQQYIKEILVDERRWEREWKAMWDPRKDHVRRALFAFFKGESIDVRKRIYMMFRTCWLHDFTKPC